MDQGDLEISIIGSNPFTIAAARGVDYRAVYVSYNIEESERLMVRTSVKNPLDLDGTTIACYFDSTAHYHLSYVAALNPSLKFTMVDLGAAEIMARWDDGTIDGAYIWLEAMDHIEANGGYALYTSAMFATWSKATSSAGAGRTRRTRSFNVG